MRFEGQELIGLSGKQMRHIWGQEMSMIFQDPMTSLNPLMKIGKQIAEPLQTHLGMKRDEAMQTAERLLRDVQIPEAARRLDQYPHELSGGMRQRVMIAIALACGPTLLFADEPTTALDVTVQAQILDLIEEQRRERNMSVILVTHDLGVVAGHTDEIAVMYGGRIVEKAPTKTLFANMKMPYTEALHGEHPQARGAVALAAADDPRTAAGSRQPAGRLPLRPALPVRPRPLPRRGATADPGRVPDHLYACWYPVGSPEYHERRAELDAEPVTIGIEDVAEPSLRGRVLMAGTGKAHLRDADDTLLRVEDLVVEFPVGRTGLVVNAVSGISLDVQRGETLGLVGESGCGKSTTGRAIMQLPRPTSGSVTFEGHELTTMSTKDMRAGPDPDADDLPGPDLVAEPAAQGARHRDGAADDLEAGLERRARRGRRPHAGGGRHRPDAGGREPGPPVLRRAVPAHLDRPVARARPEPDHLRRAGVGARRQRAGPGAQPARGPQGHATG